MADRVELLATCWTHSGQALPIPGEHLSPYDLRARAEAVSAAGYTGIGFTIEDLAAGAALLPLTDLALVLDDLGLVHREVELLGDWWATGERRAASDVIRHDLFVAAETLGARSIKIGADAALDDESTVPPVDLPRWAADLHDLAVQAAEIGTRVALEPLPFSNVADFTEAAALIAAADHSAAGLTVDIWHLERGPSTLAELARIPGEYVFVVELNDAGATRFGHSFNDTIRHRELPGDGVFDLAGFIRVLQDLGFPGPWGVEMLADAHRAKPLAAGLQDAFRTTMAVFDSL